MTDKAVYFEHLFQSVPAGVVLLDKDDRIIDCNAGFKVLFGFDREESIGRKINDLIVPERFQDEGLGATKTVASGQRLFIETTRKTKDGRLLHVSITGSPISLQEGSLSVIGIYQDITSRKRAEEALKESEAKLRTIFNNANIGFSIADPTGKLLMTNKWYQEYLGYDTEDMDGKTVAEITHPDDRLETQKKFSEIVNGSTDKYRLEKRFIHKDGHYVWGDLSVSALKDQDGVVKMVIGMVADITEKKQAEFNLIQREMQLSELNATKDTFISILSHDIRSPFASILGLADILLENTGELSTDEVRELLQGIRSQASLTLTLLDDILAWVRVQSGKISFHSDFVQLCRSCDAVVLKLKPLAELKNISIDCTEVGSVVAFTDEHMFRTILRNLVSNAIKFTPENGTVRIIATNEKQHVLVAVSDTGIGIEQENIPKLWDIGIPHSTTGTAGEEGTGFGLTLCKELVAKQGGSIWVESVVGKGSTFFFTLQKANT